MPVVRSARSLELLNLVNWWTYIVTGLRLQILQIQLILKHFLKYNTAPLCLRLPQSNDCLAQAAKYSNLHVVTYQIRILKKCYFCRSINSIINIWGFFVLFLFFSLFSALVSLVFVSAWTLSPLMTLRFFSESTAVSWSTAVSSAVPLPLPQIFSSS